MALTKCPDCEHDVSDAAEKCPNCARPFAVGTSAQASLALVGGATSAANAGLAALWTGASVGTALALGGWAMLPAGALLLYALTYNLSSKRVAAFTGEHRRRRLLRGRPEQMEVTAENARTIGATVRKLLEAVDDASAPALARLAEEYNADDKPRDDFFRGMGGTLCDFTVGQLDDARRLFRFLCTADYENLHVAAVPHEERVRLNESGKFVDTSDGGYRHLDRVFAILKRHDVAHDTPSGMNPTIGPWRFVITRTEAIRVRDLLEDAPEQPSPGAG